MSLKVRKRVGVRIALVFIVAGAGLVLSVAAVPRPPTGQEPVGSFQGLGFLSTDEFVSHAWDVSADGATVTGYSAVSGWYQVFRWTLATGMMPLPLLAGKQDSDGDGLSTDGSKVAGTCGSWSSGDEACVWTFDGTGWIVEGLGDLAGGNFSSHAYSMTPDGNVVVGDATSATGTEAARWTLVGGAWALQGLGDLPKGHYRSEAYGVSQDGSVVVGQGASGGGARAFRWTAGEGMVDLGAVAKMKYSAAWGCSADGNVVVGESWTRRGNEMAFRWTSAGMVGLGYLPGGTYSEAQAVSADGLIVVGGGMSSTGIQAFIWDAAHGMRRLADVLAASGVSVPSGWTLRYANGIAANGVVLTIVGVGENPDGNTEAWRAVFVE